jgi:opacity protein-like surface antigen
MRRAIICGLFAFSAGPVVAGGMAEPAPPPAVVSAVPASTDWSGPYIGLQYGMIASGNLSNPGAAFNPEFDGHLYGVFGGYRHDFGSFVVGGEIDWMTGSGELSRPGLVLDADYDRLFRAGIEAGWDVGRALVYGTIGVADIEIATAGSSGSSGYFYGVGVDFAVTDSIMVGLEILQHEFSDFDGIAPVGSEAELTTVGVNFALRF